MSRIVLESKAPTWQKADLRMTRVKDTDKNELLIFKELSWQTVRIEAKSTMSEDLTPLRLITNQARCRITIKKKLSGKTLSLYFVVFSFFHTHLVNLVNGKLYCNILWRVAFVAAVMITNERIAPRCKQQNDNWLHCIYVTATTRD